MLDSTRHDLFNPPEHRLGEQNAILSGRVKDADVREFEGPLSIKFMAAGAGLWETAEGLFRLESDRFLVLNDGQRYSLRMVDSNSVSFCAFFARGFVADVFRTLGSSDSELLDNGGTTTEDLGFFEPLQQADHWVTPQLRFMSTLSRGEGVDRGLLASTVSSTSRWSGSIREGISNLSRPLI